MHAANPEDRAMNCKNSNAAGAVRTLLVMLLLALPSVLWAAEAPSLEARLQQVEDHIAIENLLMRYAAAYNTGDADTYVSLFTADATFQLVRDVGEPPFAGPFQGRDAIRQQWFPDGASPDAGRKFGAMRHVTTNYEINVDGDAATVRAFFIEVVSNGANIPPGSKPPTIHAMGRYEDELQKIDGVWLFSKRTVITDLNTQWEP
jgi:ketosteroid isomerase-like protein